MDDRLICLLLSVLLSIFSMVCFELFDWQLVGWIFVALAAPLMFEVSMWDGFLDVPQRVSWTDDIIEEPHFRGFSVIACLPRMAVMAGLMQFVVLAREIGWIDPDNGIQTVAALAAVVVWFFWALADIQAVNRSNAQWLEKDQSD